MTKYVKTEYSPAGSVLLHSDDGYCIAMAEGALQALKDYVKAVGVHMGCFVHNTRHSQMSIRWAADVAVIATEGRDRMTMTKDEFLVLCGNMEEPINKGCVPCQSKWKPTKPNV